MSEEPDDFEGPWPKGDAMSEWKLVPVEPAPSQVASGEYEVPDPLSHRAANVARNVYRAMLDAAPAAPQQAEPVATLYQCLGRWSVELVTGGGNAELSPPQYLLDAIADATRQQTAGVQQPRGPRTPDPTMVICPACTSQFTAIPESVQAEVQRLQDALEKIKLETFDDSAELIARRALAVKLDAIRAAPQQAEPVGYFQRDCDYFEQVEDVYQWDADVIPLYLHPPPAEVQRLREAAMAVVDAYRNIGPVTVAIEDLSRAL